MSNNWFANQEVADKVKKELLEFIPAIQIAENVGCSYATVINYAKKIGIKCFKFEIYLLHNQLLDYWTTI